MKNKGVLIAIVLIIMIGVFVTVGTRQFVLNQRAQLPDTAVTSRLADSGYAGSVGGAPDRMRPDQIKGQAGQDRSKQAQAQPKGALQGQAKEKQAEDGRATDGQATGRQAADGRAADGQMADRRSADRQAADGQSADRQAAADGRAADGQAAAGGRAAGGQAAEDGRAADGQAAADGRAAGGQAAAGGRSAGGQAAADGRAAGGRSADSQASAGGAVKGQGKPEQPGDNQAKKDRGKEESAHNSISGVSGFSAAAAPAENSAQAVGRQSDRSRSTSKKQEVASPAPPPISPITGSAADPQTVSPSISYEEYEAQLKTIDEQIQNMRESGIVPNTDSCRNMAEYEYRLWDTKLNAIYSDIQKAMTEDESKKLREEERVWMKKRDETARQAASKHKGGALETTEYTTSLAESTRERAYGLLKDYKDYLPKADTEQ